MTDKEKAEIEEVCAKKVDKKITQMVDEYVKKDDWRIKENSNMGFSLQGLHNYVSSKVSALYWLNEVYSEEIKDCHVNGDFHIHNLGMISTYCCGWDLKDLLTKGFKAGYGQVESKPAKHFKSALGQVVNFFYTLQGESAGAQAFSNFDTLLAPFIRYDGLSYKEVKQAMQEFIFNMNVPTRVGFQQPFTNITMDLQPPTTHADEPVIWNGVLHSKDTYKDFQAEMTMINKAFCEVLSEGDAMGRIFSFPIPTYNITKDFNWDNPDYDFLWKITKKYGIPYFSNYINSNLKPEENRSMCVAGDIKIKIKSLIDPRIKKTIDIKDFLENYDIKQFGILTSGGYRPIKRKIIKEVEETVEITLESGKKLRTSLDHPHLIYNDENLGVVYGKDLVVGMSVSCLNNICGANNPMFGKKHSKEIKKQISDKCKGHGVSKKCRMKSAERWSGLNNPVSNQEYWDRKDFVDNSMQISPLEKTVYEFLNVQNTEFVFQKVFHHGDKALIADFYIPSKNLVVECESKYKHGTVYNEYDTFCGTKFQAYRDMGLNLLLTNPSNDNLWMKYLNKSEKIITVERIQVKETVYDIEIENQDGRRKINDFYANEILTHNCCRLRLDNQELISRGGGLFGANPMTGSIGVVTINLPRIGYLASTEEEFKERLIKLMDQAKESLEVKRRVLEEYMQANLYPISKFYLSSIFQHFGKYWANHFSTIGLVGMNEACLNLFNENIASKKGADFAKEILVLMRERIRNYQIQTGNLYNLEATPAEGTSFRLAKIDKKIYPEIISQGTDSPFYTNSTHLPVDYTTDIFEALNLQDELQIQYTGGTVFHGFLGESLSSAKACKQLVKKIATNFKLPYFTISPTFTVCNNHGYIAGEHPVCPKDKDGKCSTEVFARVVGFYRPIKQWNKGKQEEFKEREEYSVADHENNRD